MLQSQTLVTKGWFVMTPFTSRMLAVDALIIVISVGTATAQAVSPILSTLQVQKAVASSEPADNAKLSAHFAALADRYEADARRHRAMANTFMVQPARQSALSSAADH